MSYTRELESGHYIYPTGETVNFNGTDISDKALNVFLFKLFNYRKDEFMDRIDKGRREIETHLSRRMIASSDEEAENLEKQRKEISEKTYLVYESNNKPSEKNMEIFIDNRSTLQEISCFFGGVLEDILKQTKENENFKSLSSEQKDEEVKGLIEIYQVIFNSLSQRIIDLSDNKNEINLKDLNKNKASE